MPSLDRVEQQLEQIADIQRSLLPNPLPEISGLALRASYRPSERSGGDYYDLLPLERLEDGQPDPGGRWLFLVADASGHGAAASVVMVMLHAIVHAHPSPHDGPDKILDYVNQHLTSKKIEGSFVTAMAAIWDPAPRTLSYASAGHHPALLFDPDSHDVRALDAAGGLPLGVSGEHTYEAATIELRSSQSVLFYTDGILEAQNAAREEFGMERLRAAFSEEFREPDQILARLLRALREFRKGSEQIDDQTLLAIQMIEDDATTEVTSP